MTQLYHKNCGGVVAAGFQIVLRVLSFSVADKALQPGAVEANPRTVNGVIRDGQSCGIGFFCTKCSAEFATKEEFQQLEATCGYCFERHPLEQLVSATATPIMGSECLDEYLAKPDQILPKTVRRTPLSTILLAKKLTI